MDFVTSMDGVYLTPLKIIASEKGSVLHVLKNDAPHFNIVNEVYCSTVKYKEVKGWKRHFKMTLNLVVLSGGIRFTIYDNRLDSTTNGKYFKVLLSRDNYQRLTIAPGLWVAFEGMLNTENLVVNAANLIHDPEEQENIPLDRFQYVKEQLTK